MANIDSDVVKGFGEEWERFDHSNTDEAEYAEIFEQYFSIFPWDTLSRDAVGFDLGCGTGRWAKQVAPKVGTLHCIDPSSALKVARSLLADCDNVEFHAAEVDSIPLHDGSMDFGYSLGVLHHVPDTQAGLNACVQKLKPGAPFLLYLYYAFDNRPSWFRGIWRASDTIRKRVSKLPSKQRELAAEVLAAGIYWPLARTSKLLSKLGMNSSNIPLSAYQDRSYYCMRTDALDRFGTRLEQRFTAAEIRSMMAKAGLVDIEVSDGAPYWCAVGRRG